MDRSYRSGCGSILGRGDGVDDACPYARERARAVTDIGLVLPLAPGCSDTGDGVVRRRAVDDGVTRWKCREGMRFYTTSSPLRSAQRNRQWKGPAGGQTARACLPVHLPRDRRGHLVHAAPAIHGEPDKALPPLSLSFLYP